MILLDGKTLSETILSDLKLKIEDCQLKINLHVILVGDDPSSLKYVSLKQKKCQEIGVKCTVHHFDSTVSKSELLALITKLNNDPLVTGFFIQLPLPSYLDKNEILSAISPLKDVDGLNHASGVIPAVAAGIIRLLDEYHLNFTGKNVVIINDSPLIGQPLKTLFDKRRAIVTLLNDQIKNLKDYTLSADILISATGVKNLVTADMVKQESVVVDVANGDVDFTNVSEKCSYITPTFGGVGPMTIASLLQNIVQKASK